MIRVAHKADKAKKPKQKWKLWQKITLIVAATALVAGLGLLLFPPVSNYFGQQRANTIIEKFETSRKHIVPARTEDGEEPEIDDPVIAGITGRTFQEALELGEIDEEGYVITEGGKRVSDAPVVFEYDLNALYRDSVAYNKSLINHQGTVDTTDYSTPALKMSDYGLSNFYCYLSADSINLFLPVYLGASDEMMSCGAAHLSGTSLPIDQNNTNCAIAGHTDYIGRIFFDNIRKLELGDVVTVHNYWETIDYEVVETKVVPEDETADIFIQRDRQLLTLITCVYAGSDKHFDRYLVICEKARETSEDDA